MAWLRIDADLDLDPKIRRVGFWGCVAFEAALRRCKLGSGRGRLTADRADSDYLADLRGVPESQRADFRAGLAACFQAGLLARDGDDVIIPNWSKFQEDPTHAERQSRYRQSDGSDGEPRHSRHIPKVTTTGQDRTPDLDLPSPSPAPTTTGDLVGLAPDAPPLARKARSKPTATPAEREACARILDRLNALTGHAYRPDGAALALIAARLSDRTAPLTEADLLAVVEHQVRAWSGDPKMRAYLRPSTLFRPSHVGEYLSAARQTHARAVAAAAPTVCRKCQQPTNGRVVEGCHRRCYYPDIPEMWGDE